jgi:sulfatase maturation enzyme AslB (radical SAM superfamily)
MFHTEVEATSICNIRCLHCPHETMSRPQGMMSWETYTAVIEKIRRHVKGGRFSVSFSGMGEPLLNPLLCQFIKHVSNEAVTSFSSNGARLTEENLCKLLDAGLDTLYLSINGDCPVVFANMMGGLSYEKILANVRRAVSLSRGTRLKVGANVSITKANQDRVSRIKRRLEDEHLDPIGFSLCHSRGGNLRDPAVCDIPPMKVAHWACDVMKNTLFVDWQGRAHICDHDLHGEYELGDLISEPLEAVLERRENLLHDNSGLKICRECNDILRIGGTYPLASGEGGDFRDWILYLYQDLDEPLSEANEPMKWIFRIYQKENRTDRFANRLLGIEKAAQARFQRTRDALIRERAILVADKERVQHLLDERDRQFAALHADYVAMRSDWLWRVVQMIRNDLDRICRHFRGRLASL